VRRHSSAIFSVHNCREQGDALLPLLFGLVSEYTIDMVLENKKGLELNGAHQRLLCAVDVSLLFENINTIREKHKVFWLLASGSKWSLNLVTCAFMSRQRTAAQLQYKSN
jgi:hypothetical protein